MIEILDLNHVTLIVRDVDASRHFYCDVLGMEEITAPEFSWTTRWFRKGSAEIHLVHDPDADGPPGDPPLRTGEEPDHGLARHFAFAIKDVDETVRTLDEHGIQVVTGPRPRGDGVTQLFCYDPDGHLIELHTLLNAPGDGTDDLSQAGG